MKKILIALILIFFSAQLFSQIAYSPKVDSLINLVSVASIRKYVRELSGDTVAMISGNPYTILSRHYLQPGNDSAAKYIYQQFQALGLTASYQVITTTNKNVIGTKLGTKYPNQYYIICGHYDDMPSGTRAPGADDNASGVVGVLEAARILQGFNTDYTIKFIAFDEEERGLYGSKAYADTAFAHGDSIKGVINLDMIAYDGNNDGKLTVHTTNNSATFVSNFANCIRTYVPGLDPVIMTSLPGGSDHQSFWNRGYLALLSIEYTSDMTPFYHTVGDSVATLNMNYFQKMSKAALAYLVVLANNYNISITHNQIPTGNDTTARIATAVIKSSKGIGTGSNQPRLYYKVNTGSFNYVSPFYQNLDTFKFQIPGLPIGNTVYYYIAAQDSSGSLIATLPSGGKGVNPPGTTPPTDLYSYEVENYSIATIGTGTSSTGYPFYTFYHDSRTDMLFLASEINASGGIAGFITKIGFDVISASSQVMNGFYVKMQHTTATSISGFTNTGWTDVYSGTYTVPGTGWQYVNLQTPGFYWNGVNNLLVEICFDNTSYTSNSTVNGTTSSGTVRHHHLDNSAGCSLTGTSTASTRPNTRFFINTSTVVNPVSAQLPTQYELSQNFPNPFNPETKIKFAVPKESFITLKVYDILGREVASLVNENKTPGYYIIGFNASNLSSGIYYYRLESDNFVEVKKMLLLK
ncbi:MAG: M20/M25/M40 family metallo-hydrolase [Ignavibacteria bacterium]|nr:M20/M25/M40 family metallo-hydrolase [Ignavibacteria bacterium]